MSVLNILFILFTFMTSVVIARILIPRILLISLQKKLFDIPDARKVHKKAIPRFGRRIVFSLLVLFAYCLVYAFRMLLDSEPSSTYTSYLLPEMLLLPVA